jgi:carboxyl-terminal processing protease
MMVHRFLLLALLLSAVGQVPFPQTQTSAPPSTVELAEPTTDYAARLEAVISAVESRFYRDPTTESAYIDARKTAREQVATCSDSLAFRDLVNRYLQALQASHTYYLTPADWEYFHLLAIFESVPDVQTLLQQQPLGYPSIGAIVQQHLGHWVVADVMPQGPAANAGLQIGDRLLRVGDQPYAPVVPWWDYTEQPARLEYERQGQRHQVNITAQRVHPAEELLAALQASFQIREVHGRRIGYAHFYSYAGRQYQEALEEAIRNGPLRDAEALVMDLRYGLGGADPSYLNLFNRHVPQLASIDRDGQQTVFPVQWTQPLVMLVNETSRSGKEVLAFAARQHGLATLVGTRTAGAVLAGSPIVIDGQDLLYLAVRDVRVDGQRLEGVGVAPDHEVAAGLLDCQGVDRQLERAWEVAHGLLENTPVAKPTPAR